MIYQVDLILSNSECFWQAEAVKKNGSLLVAESAMTVGASLTVPMALNPKTMGGALVEFST